ncbi:MAG TPA: sugar phosphate nucleotidyltransferase, partial [bacterium]|nr:sugar phosphate nucleotidyltransferase [bacterium]
SMIDVFSIRQKDPLGLGHAVLKGTHSIKDEPFAVLLPDMLVIPKKGESSMKKMVELYEKTGLSVIALMKVPEEMKGLYGVAEVKPTDDENIVEINKLIEKPSKDETESNLAMVGRYVFSPEIVNILKNTKPGKGGEIQLTDAIIELMKQQKVLGLVIDEDSMVFDTGSMEGFALANTYMALQRLPQMSEKIALLIHKSDIRPWGSWISLEQGEGYQVKHIFVAPKGKLSLQKHKHRAEIWTVVEGSGYVTVGETIHQAAKGNVFRIEVGEIHRAEGSEEGMHIIEVQLGDYLGEDDIIRIEDIYGRK